MPGHALRPVLSLVSARPSARRRTGAVAGVLSITGYVAVLIAFVLSPGVHPARLASSPAGVAAGHVSGLLSSGLVIEGPHWPQVALVAGVLGVALWRLGPVRTWCVALVAHVGGTLVVYLGLWLVWLTNAHAVRSVTHAPDYGVSVVLIGELGAVLRTRAPRLVAPGIAVLTVAAAVPLVASGAIDPVGLAGMEHLAGFGAGVLMARAGRMSPLPGVRSKPLSGSVGPEVVDHLSVAALRTVGADGEQDKAVRTALKGSGHGGCHPDRVPFP